MNILNFFFDISWARPVGITFLFVYFAYYRGDVGNFGSRSISTHLRTRANGWAAPTHPASHPRVHKTPKGPPRPPHGLRITFFSSWQHPPPPRAKHIAIWILFSSSHVGSLLIRVPAKFGPNRANSAICAPRTAFILEVGNR